MLNGRPLPAYLEIPTDILYDKKDVEEIQWMQGPAPRARTGPDPELIASAAEQIARAKRPVIWAGGGVNRAGAGQEIAELAETLNAPVVMTTQGRGAISADHPLAVVAHPGSKPVVEWLQSADCLIAIGTRFSEEATWSWTVRLPRNLIHIDIDPEELGRNYPVNVGILADAKLGTKALTEALKPVVGSRPSREAEAREVNNGAREFYHSRMPQEAAILDEIRGAIPRDTVVVSDSTRVGYWATLVMPFFQERSFIYPGYGTLGGGLPTALGVKMGAPERPVLVFCGDGGFQYSFPDLSTAVQMGINIVVLLVNDSSYGVLVDQQDEMYKRRSGVELTNPDFGGIVKSYGLNHIGLDDWTGIGGALKEALSNDKTTVVEVRKGIASPPWGDAE
jgi:acetolactate synthase-1/2/3 large subunit